MLKADLHIHSCYSMDSQTPLDKIIERCQQLGINCIAIADHGTAQGGLELQKIAPFKVIVAEEILTTDGEIMGMFLKETIKSENDARLTPQEAIKRIREQGALVNIPHPFETIRGSALKDETIDAIAGDIDLMEVLNSRSPFPRDFPISGSFFGPKTNSATTKITINSGTPMFPIFSPLFLFFLVTLFMIHGILEMADTFANSFANFRESLRSKQKEDNYQNDEKLGKP